MGYQHLLDGKAHLISNTASTERSMFDISLYYQITIHFALIHSRISVFFNWLIVSLILKYVKPTLNLVPETLCLLSFKLL